LRFSVKKSLAWLGVTQIIAFALQFSSSIVLARYLTPYEMGIFAIALATTVMLSILQGMGLQALIVREEVLTEGLLRTAFTVNALIQLLISAFTAICAYLVAKLMREGAIKDVMLVLAISPLFGIFSFLPGAQLERHGKFKTIALISVSTSVVGAASTIVLAILNFKFMSLAYSFVLSSATLATLFVVAGRSDFACRFGISAWKRVLDFGFQMLAISSLNTFSQRLCDVLLGRILDLSALGLYNRASSLNSTLWGNINYLLSRIILVDFALVHREGKSLHSRYLQAMAVVTGALWPAFAGLATIAEPFITIVYGKRWVDASAPLRLLALASLIQVGIAMSWEVFAITGNLHVQTRLEAVRTPLSIFLFAGGCLIGLEAAAFSRVLDALIAAFLYMPHLSRMTGTPFSAISRVYVQSAILTLVAIAPASVLLALSPTDPSAATLAGAVTLGISLWGVTLVLLNHPISIEVLKTLRRFFPRFPIGTVDRPPPSQRSLPRP
jgi:O-antigen/teichoic acid export membrane protein